MGHYASVTNIENPPSSLVLDRWECKEVLSSALIIKMQWKIFSMVLQWVTQ